MQMPQVSLDFLLESAEPVWSATGCFRRGCENPDAADIHGFVLAGGGEVFRTSYRFDSVARTLGVLVYFSFFPKITQS